jgi:hypothetical protein
MIVFDKQEIRNSLTIDDIYNLLTEWGGSPEVTSFGLISSTICHNEAGAGSRKLYYYTNSDLFYCYSGCEEPSFDIFQLVEKIAAIQWHKEFDLNAAVRWIANRLGINGTFAEEEDKEVLEDWKYLDNYSRIQDIEIKVMDAALKEYNSDILSRFNYDVLIDDWLREGISLEVMKANQIGYYAGGNQITIPHYDKDGRLVGIRGRSLSVEDAERFGKYRPLKVLGQWYNHPLGLNLYGFDKSKENIGIIKKAIVFESEKSHLLYSSYFGLDNNISVACCGSSLSNYQVQLLIEAGAEEIIIAFDRQWQEEWDDEYKKLTAKLLKIREKYKQDVLISFMFDKDRLTRYKDSPIDDGPEVFLKLFKERIVL